MEDARLSRIEILFQQQKYAEAERVLRDLLTEDANNVYILSLLAEANFQQGKNDIARSIIDNAIGLSPATPNLYFIKSRIAVQEDKYDESEANIQQAIALNPYHADYFALFANIKLVRKKYNEALELADEALSIDAENLVALNVRSTSLLKLNRKEDSFNTIEGALREDPNNAYTHANYGWGLLEKGNHKKALNHFKESLKNNPNYEYAQAGMIEALKASNPVYRLFLKYAFWMGNLTSKYQWGVIIGFYLLSRLIGSLAENNASLEPYLTPLIVVLTIFAFSTWVMKPISNLFLRFNAYGKFLLSKKEKMSSGFVAISLLVSIAGIVSYFVLSDERYLTIGVFGFAMMVPLSSMFSPTKYKNALLIYAIAMAVIGIASIGITFTTGELFNVMGTIFLFGFIGFQWGANFLLIKQNNR